MHIKQKRFLITFPSTTAAIAMEQYCISCQIPGRLIPTPRQITASCGMAWSAPPEQAELVRRAIREGALKIDAEYLLEI